MAVEEAGFQQNSNEILKSFDSSFELSDRYTEAFTLDTFQGELLLVMTGSVTLTLG